MFSLDCSGVLTWEELGTFFDILQFPQTPLDNIKEWAGVASSSARGLTYEQWKRLLHSNSFKKFIFYF